MNVRPPRPDGIGAEITGLDVTKVNAEDAARIRELVYQHKLVVFRGQRPTTLEYIELARKIGRPQIYLQSNYHHPEHPEIFVSSNMPDDAGRKVGVSGTGRYWHTDYQFMPEPLPMTMLYPQRWPESKRETYYVDMTRVLRGLPAHLTATLKGRRAVHDGKLRYKVQAEDIDRSIAELFEKVRQFAPPVTHPAIIEHPVTKTPILYMSEGFTVGLEGVPYEEAQRALAEIFAFTKQPEHIHTQVWGDADILLWDNRYLIHMASTVPPGQPSVSYRIGIYDGLPFYETRGHA